MVRAKPLIYTHPQRPLVALIHMRALVCMILLHTKEKLCSRFRLVEKTIIRLLERILSHSFLDETDRDKICENIMVPE